MARQGTPQNTKREAPTAAGKRQHERQHRHDGHDFADQETVGVDRGAEPDPLRQPGAHQRRHRRLHHRDAETRNDGGGVERRHIGGGAAQRRADAGQHEARRHRRDGAETRDQQRSRHRRAGEQRHRQAGQDADLGLRHAKFVVNERNQRRHRQNGHAHAGAGEPQHQQAQYGRGRWLAAAPVIVR